MERLNEESVDAFRKGIRCLNHREQLERYFLLSAAPVLMGIKPSTLICIQHCCKDVWKEQEKHVSERTGLCVKELYQTKTASGLLIYDESLLHERIRNLSGKELLQRYGYPTESALADLLEHLKGRFGGAQFPHEIGVFLGYPPEDVDAFIRNSGKDYLCCRYWKVYHDEQRARKIFGLIDYARARAANLVTQQVPVYEAARILTCLQLA